MNRIRWILGAGALIAIGLAIAPAGLFATPAYQLHTAGIEDGAVTSAKIAADTIAAADIAAGAVGTSEILDGTIVCADTNDGATTDGVLCEDSAATISGAWTHSAALTLDDGTTDTPKLNFVLGATDATWSVYAEDTGDDLQIETPSTASAETADFVNPGAGVCNVTIEGDLTVSGDDLVMGTNTDAFMLVADGTNFNPVAMSGDVTIANTGATTIGADKVALTTDTTGNYATSVTTSVLTGLTGGAVAAEGTTHALALDYTATIGADPALAASICVHGTTGLICEGATANTIETLLTFADPAGADVTITVPNTTGTLVGSGDTGTVTGTMLLDATVDEADLADFATTRKIGGRDLGRGATGYFYLSGNVADADTVTINSRVYEFDNNAAITGDVTVDVTGDLTPDNAITALCAAVNGDGSKVVNCLAWTGNTDTTSGATFVATTAQGTNYTLAKTCANGVVSAAALTGAAAITNRDLWFGSYTVTAADVTTWARSGGNEVSIYGVTSSTATPTLFSFLARTSGNVVKSPATVTAQLRQVNSAFYSLTVDDGGAILASGDILTFAVAQ